MLSIANRLSVDSSVSALPKVGQTEMNRLAKLGIATVRDMLLTLPFGWESYGEPTPIKDLAPGKPATVVATVESISYGKTRWKKVGLTQATLDDGSGETLRVAWFNAPWVAGQLKKGDRVALAGIVKQGRFGIEMTSPHYEKLAPTRSGPASIGGLMPKYHLVAGLTNKKIAGWVDVVLPLADRLEDALPLDVIHRQRLMPIAEAVRKGHKPDTEAEWREAKRRMGFQHLFELQAAFAMMRAQIAAEPAQPIAYRQEVIDRFKAGLGFELTHAQKRSTWEAFQDMHEPVPMNRLLNGDVGSGKTAVAAACVAMAHAAGLQSVVMAPTEILARQHLNKFRAYLEESFPGLTVELVVSGQNAAERRRVRTAAASGHCALVVGTHALIEDDVEFANLGLAVVDEQHRFGTRQRELLRAKGTGRPHFLAMTATPIPRTLALAVYGEMAVSVIDEQPPGRTPVTTQVVPPGGRDAAYELVRNQVRAGRQAFVICPLIEESEALAARSATAEFERLRKDVFGGLEMGLVHGRLKDKDDVMKEFVEGRTQVLVATAVVEVGVDVPNATVMMIEGADRFGLAQLHQFRGRVGRGAHQSHCLLLADDPSEATLERLELMTQITDGFRLAEEDLRIRGMGELMGARQHGMTDEAMDALRNPVLLSEAREEAERVLQADPELKSHEALRAAVARRLQVTSIS